MADRRETNPEQDGEYARGVNDALDILEEYRNVPREAWNRIVGLIEGENG